MSTKQGGRHSSCLRIVRIVKHSRDSFVFARILVLLLTEEVRFAVLHSLTEIDKEEHRTS